MSCTGPNVNTQDPHATIDGLHPTGQGIEGHLHGTTAEDNCAYSLHFSAVLNVNN